MFRFRIALFSLFFGYLNVALFDGYLNLCHWVLAIRSSGSKSIIWAGILVFSGVKGGCLRQRRQNFE